MFNIFSAINLDDSILFCLPTTSFLQDMKLNNSDTPTSSNFFLKIPIQFLCHTLMFQQNLKDHVSFSFFTHSFNWFSMM